MLFIKCSIIIINYYKHKFSWKRITYFKFIKWHPSAKKGSSVIYTHWSSVSCHSHILHRPISIHNCITAFEACFSFKTFHRSRTASPCMRHPEGLIGNVICVWLFINLSIDCVCSFKWSLSILTCCHIYQCDCVGGTDRTLILLFRHNCSWLICRGEWIPPNQWDVGWTCKNLSSSYLTLE